MNTSSKKHKTIVCMGDSITEGFGLGDNSSVFYPSALKEYLGKNYTVYNKGVTCSCVINTEYNGAPMGLPYVRQPRYTEALELKGDIYIVMLGTNDASDGFCPETGKKDPAQNLIAKKSLFIPCYQRIIDDIKASAPTASVFLVSPIPIMNSIWPKHQEHYLAKLIPMIKKLARENNLYYIDLHKEFLLLPEDQLNRMYQADGLHPNILGAQVIASLIAGYVKVKTI